MIDLLSTLHTLLSHYTNTSSHDMLEMFCSVSPIAAYSNEIVPTVPKHNVVHIDDTIYTVTLNVDGPPIQGYIVEIGDEYLAIECIKSSPNTDKGEYCYNNVAYIPFNLIEDVCEC